jgi:hypothetical protein
MKESINSNDIFIKKKFNESIWDSVRYIINSVIFEIRENTSKKRHK